MSESDNVANMATYEKWTGKFQQLMESPWFNDKKRGNQANEYVRALIQIKELIK